MMAFLTFALALIAGTHATTMTFATWDGAGSWQTQLALTTCSGLFNRGADTPVYMYNSGDTWFKQLYNGDTMMIQRVFQCAKCLNVSRWHAPPLGNIFTTLKQPS